MTFRFFSSLLGAIALIALAACQPPPKLDSERTLGLQNWTLRGGTFAEALDKASTLGITTIEAYPGQALGGDLEGKFHHSMDAATLDAVKKLLAEKKITVAGYGVLMSGDEAEWKQIFSFGKSLGVRWISAEPPVELLPFLSTQAKESGIKIAFHNHPSPSRYSDPRALMETLAPYGPEFGVNADTGHWARSGFVPLEMLRLCLPRLVTAHFKDLNEWTRAGRDMPWGTGVSDAAGMLAALRQAGFNGVVLLEYEHQSPELMNDLSRCAGFFRAAMDAPLDQLVGGLVPPPGFSSEVEGTWAGDRGANSNREPLPRPLFAPDLSNAEFPKGSWTFADGILKANGKGASIWTKDEAGDFILSVEFRAGATGNSGVFIRRAGTASDTLEVEINGSAPETGAMATGALCSVAAVGLATKIDPDKWHSLTILAQGSDIFVQLDGAKVVDAKLSKWTDAGKNPDGTVNGFSKPLKDLPQKGRIGLQDAAGPVEFRNLMITDL
jgi:sugar phosphate isomerase/epimerase